MKERILVDDIKQLPMVKAFIEIGNQHLGSLGFTEHSFRHAGLVASIAEGLGQRRHIGHRPRFIAQHAMGVGRQSGHQRTPRCHTDGAFGVCLGVVNAVGSQLIERRCSHSRMPGCSQQRTGPLVDGNQEYIRMILHHIGGL